MSKKKVEGGRCLEGKLWIGIRKVKERLVASTNLDGPGEGRVKGPLRGRKSLTDLKIDDNKNLPLKLKGEPSYWSDEKPKERIGNHAALLVGAEKKSKRD